MPRGELTLSQVFVPFFLKIYSISSFLDERAIFVLLLIALFVAQENS